MMPSAVSPADDNLQVSICSVQLIPHPDRARVERLHASTPLSYEPCNVQCPHMQALIANNCEGGWGNHAVKALPVLAVITMISTMAVSAEA